MPPLSSEIAQAFCRLVYNTPTMPPAIIGPDLDDYGDMLKHCMTTIVQENIPDASWTLAQLGISNGGKRDERSRVSR